MAVNDVLFFPTPSLTNQGPAFGRVLVVAAGANVVQFDGGGFGSEGFPFTATLTDAQIATPLAFPTKGAGGPDNPATIGNLDMGGNIKVQAVVLAARWVNIGAGVKDPFTGLTVAAPRAWQEVAYIEICRQCNGQEPSLILGGERFMCVLATAPDDDGGIGVITTNPNWVIVAPGFGAVAPIG